MVIEEEVTRSMFRTGGKTVVMVLTGAEFSFDLLVKLMKKIMGKDAKDDTAKTTKDGEKSQDIKIKRGQQSIKSLVQGENGSLQTLDVTETSIGSFKNTARKYGVDYAVRKDSSTEPARWMVFFRGKDEETINAAFREYTGKVMEKARKAEKQATVKGERREARAETLMSIRERLESIKQNLAEKATEVKDRVKNVNRVGNER
jgi:hypothetical protein